MKKQINEIKRMQQLAGILKEDYEDIPPPSWSLYDKNLSAEDEKWINKFYHSVDNITSNDKERAELIDALDKMKYKSRIIALYRGKLGIKDPHKAAQQFAGEIIGYEPKTPNIYREPGEDGIYPI